MKEFTRITLTDLRNDMQAALEQVAKKHGIKITLGRCRFTAETANWKLDAVAPVDGAIVPKEVIDFQRYAGRYGLKPGDLYRKFAVGNNEYTLCGAKPNNRKYPLLGASPNGERFKFRCNTVLEGLLS